MEQFWPGPLTILFPKSDLVPDLVTAGLEQVAIRMPPIRFSWRFSGPSENLSRPQAQTVSDGSVRLAQNMFSTNWRDGLP